MCEELRSKTIVVDNRVNNLGVPKSWNVSVDKVLEINADWLIIISAAMRFGKPGGHDLLDTLRETDPNSVIAIEAGHGIGWHLISFPRHVFEATGKFDENFNYREDEDFARRISLAYGLKNKFWDKHSFDCAIAGFSHGVDLGGAVIDNEALLEYYRQKHGGDKGAETFKTPFNLQDKDFRWWPTPGEEYSCKWYKDKDR